MKLPAAYLTSLVFSVVLSTCQLAAQAVVLEGRVEYQSGPQVEQFAKAIENDPSLGCTSCVMSRLLNVAHDAALRKKVWKRMLNDELYWTSSKSLKRIETIAASCDMPLK